MSAAVLALSTVVLWERHRLGGDTTLENSVQVLYGQASCLNVRLDRYKQEGFSLRQQELAYLSARLTCIHPLPFRVTTESQFQAAIDELNKRVNKMTRNEYLVALLRVVAMIGDSHTYLNPPADMDHRYSLAMVWFPDGFHIIAAPDGCVQCAGSRLVSINGHDAEAVYRSVVDLIPHENEIRTRERAGDFMLWREVMDGLHLGGSGRKATFEMESNGKHFRVELDALGDDVVGGELRPPKPVPQWMPIQQPAAIYFKHNSGEKGFEPSRTEIESALTEKPLARLIVDLRDDGGGDDAEFDRFIVETRRIDADRKRLVFVLVGPRTFSSGIDRAMNVKRTLGAILVGSATSGRPQYCAGDDLIKLPVLGAKAVCSTMCDAGAASGPATLLPDVNVATTWADYKGHDDPVLKRALASPIGEK